MSIGPAAYGSATCEFALRNLHKSPGHAGWGCAAPAADARAAAAAGPRRLVQVSRGWPRAATPLDLRAPAGRGRARRRPQPAPVRGARASTRAFGCTFFAVCCAFVCGCAVSCTFFSVCCKGGRARGAPPPFPSNKNAGQTNENELAYRKYDAEGAERPQRESNHLAIAQQTEKMCTKPLSAVAHLARRTQPAGARR